MSSRWRRAVATLLCLNFALTGTGYLWLSHQAGDSQTAQQREQATAQRAGAQVEGKLCKSLAKLAALPPPPGNPATNPARAWEQNVHATLDELGPDIGCGQKEGPR